MQDILDRIRTAKRNVNLDDSIDNTRRRVALHNEIFEKVDYSSAITLDFNKFLLEQGDIF